MPSLPASGGWFAGMDSVDLVESAGEAIADRLLIHYRLDLAHRGTRLGLHTNLDLQDQRRPAGHH